MEKIKSTFTTWAILVFLSGIFPIIASLYFKLITIGQIPILFGVGIAVTIYIYFLEKYSQGGFYFQDDGITYYDRNIKNTIVWDNIKIRPLSIFQWKISLNNVDKNIPFDPVYRKSIIELTKKYCPKDHELYKAVEEYSKSKNLPF